MARPTALTADIIETISIQLKLRMKWNQIAGLLGLAPNTIRRWIQRGEEIRAGERRKSGLYLELVQAIDEAKSEMVYDYSQVIRDRILNGSRTVTTKTKTVDGKSVTERIIKETGPDAALALKVLGILDPGTWGEVRQIQVDWRTSIQNVGVSPEHLERAFIQYLEENKDNEGTQIPIPALPGRTI